MYKNVLAKTQKKCREKLTQAIEKNGKVDVVRSGKCTVAEWVRLWFETYSKPSIREQTAYYCNNYIEKRIVPGIGEIKLDKLTTIQIQQFYNKLKTSGRVQRYEHIELKDKGLSNRFIHGVLRSALEQAKKEKLITGNPYLFPSPKTGAMYNPDSFRHTHEKILAAAGIEHIRFHNLRHTFAALSLQNGVDVKTLSNTLGHYSTGFTLDAYTHATLRMKRDAAETSRSVIDQARADKPIRPFPQFSIQEAMEISRRLPT